MARSTDTILNEILTEIQSDQRLVVLNSPSKTALYRLVVYIIAYAIRVNELLFDQHFKEVTDKIAQQKIGSLNWYRNKALEFQYGFDLLPDSDIFDNGDATLEEIEASDIITYAAVTEADDQQRIIVKIAGESGNELQPLLSEQEEAFGYYMNEIKFAGTPLTVINYLPDRLFLTIDIYRDPLVLDENGISILNGNVPVKDALNDFVKELPFNGELTINSMVKTLLDVDGVELVNVLNVESTFIDPQTNDYGNPESINVRKIPESGYFTVVNFENIRYAVV